MNTKNNHSTNVKRMCWLDNLRTVVIALVALYHVGGVYESAGLWGWFWIVDDPDTFMASGIIGIMLDTLAMPAIFFISGYLVPGSLKDKTAWQFISNKAKRLLLPWALAVVTLIPLYKVIFLYSRGLPQEHWTTYFHITNPNSQNWLWFLPLLFLFNMLYLIISKSGIKFPKISLVWAVVATVLISIVSSYFIGGWLGFRSWTLTPLIDFENERVVAHFLTFLIGVLCYKEDIFAKIPEKKTLYTVGNSVAWLPVTGHIFVRLWPFFVADFAVTPLYRILWFLSFHLSSLVMVYVLVESFWRYLDKPGKLWGKLNKNSYGVYIIHVIIIGVFGTLLLKLNIPGVVKYFSLTILTYGFSNLLVSLYRRVKKSFVSRGA
jgi:peptidoglycan/LPS O-acetylase OafA/YrhL